ncbi:MAG: 1-acyl-sn-glycerol-3-phosphate acyltransferase [Acidobacteriaceae bacterium]|nr:1-acyl-sn-glycerol-3-phosphate acyltransferase [Acidobacteriaceae bacterium]
MRDRLSFLRALLITDVLIVLFTIVYGAVSVAVSFFDPSGRRQMAVARAWGRALCRISGVRIRTQGFEKITPGRQYIFTPNHLSYMDTPVMLACLPVDFRFMAKAGLFRIPFLGSHLQRAGHVPVPLEDPRASIKALAHAAKIINEKNISLLIFPEGGRSEHGVLQEFKDGAAFAAIKGGIPIVPMALCGTRDILAMHSLHVRGGTVLVRMGDLIETAGLKSQDRTAVTDRIRSQIASLLGSTQAEANV